MYRFKLPVIVVALTLLAAEPVRAQPQEPPPQTVVRTYNVSDLLRAARNYPAAEPVMPPQPGPGLFGGPPAVNPQVVSSIVQLIVDVVSPESWKANGGELGSIREILGVLVVEQTPANHDKILKLLDEMRRTGEPSKIVTVRATWVVVKPGELAKPTTEVTAEWMSKQTLYCESQISCFNGQTVHLSSGRNKRIVTDVTPIVGQQSAALDPTTELVLSGVAMQVSPLLVPGMETVVLDIQTTASEWAAGGDAQPAPAPAAREGNSPALSARGGDIDRTPALRHELQTTARLPLGKKVIVGGMTLDPSDKEQAGRQLYLVVEVEAGK